MSLRVNDVWPGYTYVQQWNTNTIQTNTSRMVYSTDSLSLPVLTHCPASISVHDPNQYSGQNHPQRHSAIPSMDVYTNANTVICCQPLTNTRTSKRHPRESVWIIGTEFQFVKDSQHIKAGYNLSAITHCPCLVTTLK